MSVLEKIAAERQLFIDAIPCGFEALHQLHGKEFRWQPDV